jgi:hypothetical protein
VQVKYGEIGIFPGTSLLSIYGDVSLVEVQSKIKAPDLPLIPSTTKVTIKSAKIEAPGYSNQAIEFELVPSFQVKIPNRIYVSVWSIEIRGSTPTVIKISPNKSA